ncbi:MAG: tRNA uridine-5-carboxymethylaminomethyl(34) synthesis GTPase MnmE [Gemmatimonadaceae bacterium]
MVQRTTVSFNGGDETIAAIATASGRGAVALIRVSGFHALNIAEKLGVSRDIGARVATRCALRDPTDGSVIDDALVTYFAAPNSFTGENVVELSTHGGQVVPSVVLAACIAAGARQALPGEFTRRALLNGRIDLLQAEAIADLVDARTRAMQSQALAQLDGGLSRRLMALRGEIIGLEVLLAYDIDFPEEDDGPIAPARIAAATDRVRDQLKSLLATAPRAALVRDGALVVIAGPPNAGKSSLFNALLGEGRALVTEIPGTTRDAIEALLDTPKIPLRLVDTAGLRTTDDIVERLGIEVSERYVGNAQLVLACAENVEGLLATFERVRPLTNSPMLAVLTKSDGRANLARDLELAVSATGENVLAASAERGTGLSELLTAIVAQLSDDSALSTSTEDTRLTRERHRVAIAGALEEVVAFERAWREEEVPATIAAVHLRSAAHTLDELVGAINVDDVLDRLFRDFCVGK